MPVQSKISSSRRIIIKIGTAIITQNKILNEKWLREKIKEIAHLKNTGKEILVISSGAVGTGMLLEGLTSRPKEILKLQMLSGKGQPMLMNIYRENFAKHEIQTAQVLLTHHNFSNAEEVRTFRDVVNGYLKEGTIPIINENDIISKDEFTSPKTGYFSDNDELSAMVALSLDVDLLVILTDVDGLFTSDPRKNPEAKLVPVVRNVTDEIIRMASKDTNGMGLGGMLSKVMAAKKVSEKGTITIVGNGLKKLDDIISGKSGRTIFYSE
ncbi:glutamate 5-kinase [Candidatus Woesearchaeota archaeon]|nr:glutamate 5-kinase [Candidatus Woesearchaeota archaeon]